MSRYFVAVTRMFCMPHGGKNQWCQKNRTWNRTLIHLINGAKTIMWKNQKYSGPLTFVKVMGIKGNSIYYNFKSKSPFILSVNIYFNKEFSSLICSLCWQKPITGKWVYLFISCRSLVFSGTVHWFEGRQAFIHYCGLHQVWREPGN